MGSYIRVNLVWFTLCKLAKLVSSSLSCRRLFFRQVYTEWIKPILVYSFFRQDNQTDKRILVLIYIISVVILVYFYQYRCIITQPGSLFNLSYLLSTFSGTGKQTSTPLTWHCTTNVRIDCRSSCTIWVISSEVSPDFHQWRYFHCFVASSQSSSQLDVYEWRRHDIMDFMSVN